MNKVICDTLNLPTMEDLFSEEELIKNRSIEKAHNNDVVDEEGIVEHDGETSEILDKALAYYDDLTEMSMNMEPKNAGSVATAAASILKVALDASKSKVDSKLMKSKLELEKQKLRLKQNDVKTNVIDITEETFVGNRNDILKAIKNSDS